MQNRILLICAVFIVGIFSTSTNAVSVDELSNGLAALGISPEMILADAKGK
jgi:hypothetical protein